MAPPCRFQPLRNCQTLRIPDGAPPALPQTHPFQCDTPALLPSAPMTFQSPTLFYPGPLRGCLCVGGGAVVREIWPYKPVAHSLARR